MADDHDRRQDREDAAAGAGMPRPARGGIFGDILRRRAQGRSGGSPVMAAVVTIVLLVGTLVVMFMFAAK
ncbi:MAG TPA: hypothetical protein VMX97_12055 [Hyphomicrobiaceae bacterium]|nr:hypothetical protein [Hyphomicrobiaceae bacterium]